MNRILMFNKPCNISLAGSILCHYIVPNVRFFFFFFKTLFKQKHARISWAAEYGATISCHVIIGEALLHG
jgi:hypothetical protein